MSVKVMAQVWELDLPHAEKFVLLAMADHADHDGGNVYPSVLTVARKTGYSERQVQRVIDSLEARGLLVPTQQTAGAATVYRVDTAAAPKVTAAPKTAPAPRPAATPPVVTKCHPCQNVTPDICDTDPGQNVTTGGDILSPPYLYKEPSFEPSSQPSVSGSRYPADMIAFWQAFPAEGRSRSSQKDTQTEWSRMTPQDRLDAKAGLSIALTNRQFLDYPPAAHRWLRSRKWEVFNEGLPLESSPRPAPPPSHRNGHDPAMTLQDKAAAIMARHGGQNAHGGQTQ
jgi:hypothetical protein